MTLNNAKIGVVYTVDSLNLDIAIRRRLEALGLTKGTNVMVLNRSRAGAIVLKVRGSRLALGKKIAETIHMKEAS
jgi:ferrous iron transport protein A